MGRRKNFKGGGGGQQAEKSGDLLSQKERFLQDNAPGKEGTFIAFLNIRERKFSLLSSILEGYTALPQMLEGTFIYLNYYR